MKKKKFLGKGLQMVLEISKKDILTVQSDLPDHQIHMIHVGEIKPGKGQPRRIFDQASLHELAASIKAQGLLQPILVRKKWRAV